MTIIISFVILLIILETITAFIIYPLKTGKIYYQLIKDEYFIYRFNPVLGFSLKYNCIYQNPSCPCPNGPRRIMTVDIRTDKNGFLFTEDIALLKEKLIFCIGGSTTMGSESRYNKTYPAILDSLVKAHGYRCINTGVGGYRSIHELLLLKNKILPYGPAMVIIFSGYNDFEDAAYNSSRPYNQFSHCLSHSIASNRLEEILFFSSLLHMLKRVYYRLTGRVRTETAPNITKNLERAVQIPSWLNEWKDNIVKIIDLCKTKNIKCCLLSNVSPAYEGAPDEAKDFADCDLNMQQRFDIYLKYTELINNASEQLCKEKGVRFIDITSDFNGSDYKKRFLLFVDRMHFTEQGNLLLASSIYKKIKEGL